MAHRYEPEHYGARDRLVVDGESYDIFRLDRVQTSQRLPYSLRVLLENLVRNEDGRLVTGEQVAALTAWNPLRQSNTESSSPPHGC